ncbi:MAG: hypothetical protein GY929_23700 [Actinomycetia bacterium]|nr:hypothetical protein [Actinomycetes bacterium]
MTTTGDDDMSTTGDDLAGYAGSDAGDESDEVFGVDEEDEFMALNGELAELEAERAGDEPGGASAGDPPIEVSTVDDQALDAGDAGAEKVDAGDAGAESEATLGDEGTEVSPDTDADKASDAETDEEADGLETPDAAVLDLTAEVSDAEAAFLDGQPPESETDVVALDLSNRVDLEAELDLSEADGGPDPDLTAELTAHAGRLDLDGSLAVPAQIWEPDPVLAPPTPVAPIDPPAVGVPTQTPAPQPARPRLGRRMRARKVRRIIRYIDPWSVLKFSFLFYSAVFVILMIAGVLLWSAAVSSGTVDNMEDFIKDLLALKSFAFEPNQIFRASALGGAILVVASTAGTVLLAILFNLISDLIGGIRVTVVELETARPAAAQSVVKRVTPVAPDTPSGRTE